MNFMDVHRYIITYYYYYYYVGTNLYELRSVCWARAALASEI